MLCLEATKQLQLALTWRSKHQASGAVISEDRSPSWTFLLPLELAGWIEADITLLLFHVGGVNPYNFRLRSACGPLSPRGGRLSGARSLSMGPGCVGSPLCRSSRLNVRFWQERDGAHGRA